MALLKAMRFTLLFPARNRSFARFCTHAVTSLSAGPPLGGLYLKPPSSGGLWDGVITMPSARPAWRLRLYVRIEWEITGVGVYPRPLSTITWTPCAESTSSAVWKAGSDRAWVSRPRNRGPSMPLAVRYRHIASVM